MTVRTLLIDTATKLGIDGQLRRMRAAVFPLYRRQAAEERQLRSLLESVLVETSNCIDIGAHRGRMLEEMLRVAPRGRHIAYEPLPHLYRSLVKRFPSVDVRQAAVSNEVGETAFAYIKSQPARSGFHARVYGGRKRIETLTIQTETLDSSLPEGYVPDLIKIDVEGAERLVFEGGITMIAAHKPVIIFEHGLGGADHYDTQPRQIYELLHDRAGLRLFDLDRNGPYTLEQFEATYARNERWDFVARP